MVRILALCCGIKSMNEITNEFNTDETINNINLILSEVNVELPHRDTIVDVLKTIDVRDLEKLNTKLIKKLIRSKILDNFRINCNGKNYFHIVIDGTGLFSSKHELDKMAITKTYNKGRNRWKIENHGFRDQKEGVINISHIYSKDYNVTKCNYLLSQIAHTFLTLLNNGSILIKVTRATKKDVSKNIQIILTSKIFSLNQNRKIQLRLL